MVLYVRYDTWYSEASLNGHGAGHDRFVFVAVLFAQAMEGVVHCLEGFTIEEGETEHQLLSNHQ